MAKMSYQEARAVRNMPKLSELIRQNAVGGMSAGGAIKAAVKEKLNVSRRLKAKVVGIKERFDPMNIAKFMTGGSKTAAALVGRWTGRSQKDIENFAGGVPRGTADRIGALPQHGGGQSNLVGVLTKIYSLLQKANEDALHRKEMDANRDEERQLEDEARHKKLMDALGGETGSATAISEGKKESGGMLGKMMEMLNGIKKWVTALFENFDIMKYLNKLSWFSTLFKFLGSSLFRLVFMNPVVLAATGAAALLAALYGLAKIHDEHGNRTLVDDAIDKAAEAVSDKLPTPEANMEKFDRIMAEGGDSKTAQEAFKKRWLERKSQGAEVSPEEAQAIKLKYNIEWPTNQITSNVIIGADGKAVPVKQDEDAPFEQEGGPAKEVKGYLKRRKKVEPTKTEETKTETKPVPPKVETKVPTANPDDPNGALNRATQENTNAKIDRITKSVSHSDVNNVTNVNGQNAPAVLKTIPSVRNQEETLMNIVYSNIRIT